jgi:hypothetical protein
LIADFGFAIEELQRMRLRNEDQESQIQNQKYNFEGESR